MVASKGRKMVPLELQTRFEQLLKGVCRLRDDANRARAKDDREAFFDAMTKAVATSVELGKAASEIEAVMGLDAMKRTEIAQENKDA